MFGIFTNQINIVKRNGTEYRFLYVFTWLWHSYGEISIMGLMYAIGVQVVDIIGVVFYLLMPLNREIICIYWLKFLLGVLFWAAGIGIFDMAKKCRREKRKNSTVF